MTENEVIKENGKPDVTVSSAHLSADEKLMQDIADEFWIYFNKDANGGCIVYGRFKKRWVVNPSLRWPLAEMCRINQDLSEELEHRDE